jgi:hypothetical protein
MYACIGITRMHEKRVQAVLTTSHNVLDEELLGYWTNALLVNTAQTRAQSPGTIVCNNISMQPHFHKE